MGVLGLAFGTEALCPDTKPRVRVGTLQRSGAAFRRTLRGRSNLVPQRPVSGAAPKHRRGPTRPVAALPARAEVVRRWPGVASSLAPPVGRPPAFLRTPRPPAPAQRARAVARSLRRAPPARRCAAPPMGGGGPRASPPAPPLGLVRRWRPAPSPAFGAARALRLRRLSLGPVVAAPGLRRLRASVAALWSPLPASAPSRRPARPPPGPPWRVRYAASGPPGSARGGRWGRLRRPFSACAPPALFMLASARVRCAANPAPCCAAVAALSRWLLPLPPPVPRPRWGRGRRETSGHRCGGDGGCPILPRPALPASPILRPASRSKRAPSGLDTGREISDKRAKRGCRSSHLTVSHPADILIP